MPLFRDDDPIPPNPLNKGDSKDDPPIATRGMTLKYSRLKRLSKEVQGVRDKGFVAVTSSNDRDLFLGMFNTLEGSFRTFTQLWDDIEQYYADHEELECNFPSSEQAALFVATRGWYYEAQGFHVTIMSLINPPNPTVRTTLNPADFDTSFALRNPRSSRNILPEISIKEFKGEFSEWSTFQQTFNSLIIQDKSLDNTERFHYLLAYTKGPAFDLIKHIPIIGDNFQQAWNALTKVYDDKRHIACTYINRLLTFKPAPGNPTIESLQSYLAQVSESVTSIKNLGIPSLADYLLTELALRGLDPKTRDGFETSVSNTNFPTVASLETYVRGRCNVLRHTVGQTKLVETPKPNAKPFRPPNRFTPTNHQAFMAHSSSTSAPDKPKSNPRICFVCKQDHRIAECPQFRAGTPAERLDMLKRFPGCRCCLSVLHKSAQCQSKYRCRKCNGTHHTDLHLEFKPTANSNSYTSNQPLTNISSGTAPTSFSGHSAATQTGVLLGTIVAKLQGSNGRSKIFRGIMDPGSQLSFATEALAKQLNQSTRPYKGAISGVNHSPLRNIKGKITLTILPKKSTDTLVTDAIVVPSISPFLPQSNLDHTIWQDYFSYELSDPSFHKAGPVDFLIGADLYPDCVTGVPIIIQENGPRLMPTVFGFTVMGRYSHKSPENLSVSLLALSDLPNLMQRFWEVEETQYSPLPSPEDEQCERHFQETHYRNAEGRYVVRLPFKKPPPEGMFVNVRRALNRFHSLESKFVKNEAYAAEYRDQMAQYIQLGHMRLAESAGRYVIPHHGVFKEEKLRVVFDASFSTGSGSLNSYLHTGPRLQADISAILLNFRRFTFVLKCDIVKMFRQILVDPADRCFQQIIWRSSPDEPIRFYELNVVTFGICSSPFQAIRVLHEHARKYLDKYPDAASAILNSTYVDDVTAGSHSLERLMDIKAQLIEILKDAGFELSKWNSNHPSLLHDGDGPTDLVSLGTNDDNSTKILGIHWDPKSDVYAYRTSAPPEGYTKRTILSAIARLFDPLGYLGPVIFYAKLTMQETWALPLTWDEEVPEDIKSRWMQFKSNLPQLAHIAIPRLIPPTDTVFQLLCFCDASESGFGAAIYVRGTQGPNASMTLIKSKSRVAPIKAPKTIPRLELDGAVLLTEVLKSLESFRTDMAIKDIFCFTDSMVVIAWLKTPPHRLQTYVSNRVQKILETTSVDWWRHVSGVDNPADALSRGIPPSELKSHPLWWTGPSWSTRPVQEWPSSPAPPPIEVPELKKSKLVLMTITKSEEFINYAGRHSSFTRLIRVIAYVKRFLNNARIPKAFKSRRTVGPIDSSEFQTANRHLIQLHQHFFYPEAFTSTSNNNLPSELRKLDVFIDPEGLIRVGGRLKNAPISAEQKHQILLPTRSYFTNLVVDHAHHQNHHAGPSALIATIQQTYWIPRVRNLLRNLRHKCIVCTRYSRARQVPFMGDLPESRFAGVRPFLVTGVDMAGPFLYRESANRRAATAKAYLCLFICMSSRALHLEVTTALSVESFLDAFDRFTSRRGLPSHMMSDGGSNFRGAARYIEETTTWFQERVNTDKIISHTAHLGIKWSFNPPYAPHFGGSWEVSVRLVKDLLHKTFGNQTFTLPELMTIFTKIEGTLNSRPLQTVSSSPEDLETLTPGHFLIGQAINTLPEPDFSDIPTNRLNRWQLIRERVQFFWDRWKREYLNSLQVRQKWNQRKPNLVVGDVVLLLEANTPPTHWPLGRILEVHPGKDGIIRVATIKTAKGIYKRPVVKMVRLNLSNIHS